MMKKILELFFCILILFVSSCGQKKVNTSDSSDSISSIKTELKNTNTLPSTEEPLVLRTDFTNENEWRTICKEINTPNPEFGFIPNVVFVNDISFQNFSLSQLLSDSTSKYDHAFVFIVDSVTMTSSEHPILCIGLKHNQGLKLRVIPSEIWGIENNLSISNMDFEEFSNAVDKDGVFRGFKKD